jgi:hypothetical protein
MCVQLGMKMICIRPKKEGKPSNFLEFWSNEVQCKKDPQKKKNLMFEHYNLVDPIK